MYKKTDNFYSLFTDYFKDDSMSDFDGDECDFYQPPIQESPYEKAKQRANFLLSIGRPIPAHFMETQIAFYEKQKKEEDAAREKWNRETYELLTQMMKKKSE